MSDTTPGSFPQPPQATPPVPPSGAAHAASFEPAPRPVRPPRRGISRTLIEVIAGVVIAILFFLFGLGVGHFATKYNQLAHAYNHGQQFDRQDGPGQNPGFGPGERNRSGQDQRGGNRAQRGQDGTQVAPNGNTGVVPPTAAPGTGQQNGDAGTQSQPVPEGGVQPTVPDGTQD